MKVQNLLNKLAKLNPNMEVTVPSHDHSYRNIACVDVEDKNLGTDEPEVLVVVLT